MTSPVPEPDVPPIADTDRNADADADARFATYLADVAAHVDDPECGEDCRAILDEDPQTQRALFDLAEAMAAGGATTAPLSMLVTAVAAAVLVVAVGVCMLRWVT
ncbi:hypothetical protein [Virgisporangium aurantiacum]|uniref:Uncharacterized protein n=1 Tax=Virgisporangium aurantiacum TaxID=175570 RepID=A0A8J3ZDS3_9ACTN|nr:hypothetical protein [Virgisporangium aurantiacum]GIJ62099.1 hypothetical protein Vau01_096150 [Virgisporangium aurantiacum]